MIPLMDLYAQNSLIEIEIIDRIKEVIKKSAFIQGEYVEEFEKDFSSLLGVNYCVGCSNGTSALSISLAALGIKEGDEVITTPMTFFATVEAICHVKAKPVFVDIDKDTYNINCDEIEKAITDRTKAIIPVHLYGNPVNMEKVLNVARKYNFLVIEDCAQAHLAKFKNKYVGTFGDFGAFSFFPGKNLGALGDAGAIVTNNRELAEKSRMLVNHGRKDKYLHEMIGYNHRLDGIQAAILSVKLRYLGEWTRSRQQKANLYFEFLKDNKNIISPKITENSEHVFHLFVIQVSNRDEVIKKLKERDITASVHYPVPLHLQPALSFLGYRKGDFPVSEKVASRVLSLPLYPELTEENIRFICNELNSITGGGKNV